MSWEYSKYKARCSNCGKEGFCLRGSDDWGRSSTSWEGFDNTEPDINDVGRKRADTRDMRPTCTCGNQRIEIGDCIGDA